MYDCWKPRPWLLKALRNLPRDHISRLFVLVEILYHWAPSKLPRDLEVCISTQTASEKPSGRPYDMPISLAKPAELEVSLGKLVMGDDHDSYAVGKGEKRLILID
jgi:hypothetical protein